MLNTKAQGHWPFGSKEGFTISGHGIAPGQEQPTLGAKVFMSTESPDHFDQLL